MVEENPWNLFKYWRFAWVILNCSLFVAIFLPGTGQERLLLFPGVAILGPASSLHFYVGLTSYSPWVCCCLQQLPRLGAWPVPMQSFSLWAWLDPSCSLLSPTLWTWRCYLLFLAWLSGLPQILAETHSWIISLQIPLERIWVPCMIPCDSTHYHTKKARTLRKLKSLGSKFFYLGSRDCTNVLAQKNTHKRNSTRFS